MSYVYSVKTKRGTVTVSASTDLATLSPATIERIKAGFRKYGGADFVDAFSCFDAHAAFSHLDHVQEATS